MTSLSSYIKSRIELSDETLENIISQFEELTIDKDRFLVKAGQLVRSYYFISSGALRIYFEKDEQQVTGWLAFENEFFTELASYKSSQPTIFSIQAVEPTPIMAIDKAKMELFYQKYPVWQQFGRLIWEEAFLRVVNGIISFQTLTAEERYKLAMQQSDLLQRIPLKQLSSYLGITQTSLSRLRKKIR